VKLIDLSSFTFKEITYENNNNFIKYNLIPSINFEKDYFFFIKSQLNKKMKYTGIISFHIPFQKADELLFRLAPDFFSQSDSGSILYCGNITQENGRNVLFLRQIDCKHLIEKKVIEFEKCCSLLCSDVLLLGLDDRHVLVFDSSPQPRFGWFFQTRLLVDFADGRTYPVPEELEGDSLARLQDAWTLNNRNHFVVKTGRIQWWEKEEFWKQNNTDYTDQVETIALCRTEDLIRHIKAGRPIPWTIVDRSDRFSALRVLEDHPQCFYYSKQDFRTNDTTVFQYSLSPFPMHVKIYRFNGELETMFFRSGEGYGIRWTDENRNELELVRLNGMRPLFRTRDHAIIHTDGEFVLTTGPGDPSTTRNCIFLYNLRRGHLVQTIEDRSAFYDRHRDQVILY